MAEQNIVKAYRGPASGLPTLEAGQLGWTTDTNVLYMGDGVINHAVAMGRDAAFWQAQLNGLRPFAAPVTTQTVVVPDSIDATGTTVVTIELNAFIHTVPDGSIISFPAGATYLLKESEESYGVGGIFIKDRNNLIFEGNGTTLQVDAAAAGTSAYTSPFMIGDSLDHPNTDIVIHDFILIGNSPTPGVFNTDSEAQSSIYANAVTRLEIYNVTGSASHADFVDASFASGLWVHDCHAITAGRNGFSAERSDSDVLVEHCAFDACGWCTLDIEPLDNTNVCSNIIFRNNTAGTWGLDFAVVVPFNTGATIDGVVIDGNTVTGGSLKTGVGIAGTTRMTRIRFTNNKGVEAAGPVLTFAHVDGLTVFGNEQSLSSGVLETITDCTEVLVDGVNPEVQTLLDTEVQALIDAKLTFTPTNLITNGDGDFETSVGGWWCPDTTTRITDTPLVGVGSAKSVAVTHAGELDWHNITLIPGHRYYLAALAKTTAAAGRKMRISALVGGAAQVGTLVDCSVSPQTVSMVFTAAATSGDLVFQMDSNVAGEYFLLDSAVCYDLIGTTATVAELNWLHGLVTGTFIPASGATTQLLQWLSSGIAKWVTVSGDITAADGGALTVGENKITLAKLATQAAETLLANATASAAVPTALAVEAQTILGRITGGHIVGLTVAQILTLLGISTAGTELINDADAAAQLVTLLGATSATAAELNVLDGITATVAELNYTDGVTSAIQTQLGTKAAASAITNVDNTSDATKNAAAVTVTNHRFTRRVDTQATTDTITPEISTYDIFIRSAQAHALVINNHSSSTPVDGDMMLFEILSDATIRAITYGNLYVAKAGVALPAATVASKNLTLLFIWRNDLSQWVLLSAGQEA